jgi:hypothetical protein
MAESNPVSAGQKPSPPLQLGWLLEALPAKVPVNLRAEGLLAHTAVIAQSGSGKSFMLGRLLEEIATKTQARVLILDPNSDFARFGEVDEGAWEKKECLFAEEDTKEEFNRRWYPVGFTCMSRKSWQFNPAARNAESAPISITWRDLSEAAKANCLGLSVATHPAEYGVFQRLPAGIEQAGKLGTLEEWGSMASSWSAGRAEVLIQSYLNLASRIQKTRAFPIWDRGAASIQDRMDSLLQTTSTRRVACLDLGSLDDVEERYIVAGVALEALWEHARKAWRAALSLPAADDRRCPVFVVIDEAHNIAPEQPTTDLARTAVDTLVRIAMEGRKYGVFLILVTQRPSRVNSNLLSQCDNLCLMKMSNPADVRLAQDRFGFVPAGWAERALRFKKGEILLSGQLVERPVYAKVAPRRTVEGGRSLQESVWLTDPLPAAAK